jgi:hypothetical protein
MRLAEFKLLDDVENKQIYFQLWQQGRSAIQRSASSSASIGSTSASRRWKTS